jgi:hypothetical protein
MRAIDFLMFRGAVLEEAGRKNKVIKTIMVVDSYVTAVYCGGFMGYFSGYTAKGLPHLLDALKAIDALSSMQVVRNSFALFPDEKPHTARGLRCKQIDKIIAAANVVDPWVIDPWCAMDAQFLEGLPDLENKHLAYVLKHRSLIESFPEDVEAKKQMEKLQKRMKR